MMTLFSSDPAPEPPSPRRLARYGLYLVGAMVALWVVTRAVALPPSSSEGSAPVDDQSADSTVVAPSTASTGGSSIEVFTWGNAAAVLLLAGGGAFALYLHQNREKVQTTTPFRPLGQLSLGASKHVRLVACGGEVLLLSVTEDEVTLLKTYPQEAFDDVDGAVSTHEDPSSLPPQGSRGPNEWSKNFADVLDRFADRTPYS